MRFTFCIMLTAVFYTTGTETVHLADFNGKHSLKAWTKNKGVQMEFSAWPDNYTGACAKVFFPRYIANSGRERWPQIRFKVPSAYSNWNDSGFLRMEIFADQKMILRYNIIGPQFKDRTVANLRLEKGRNQLTVQKRISRF